MSDWIREAGCFQGARVDAGLRGSGARTAFAAAGLVVLASFAHAQTLRLPPRPTDAPGGRAWAESVRSLDRSNREERLVAEVRRGNVPDFLRTLAPVTLTNVIEGRPHVVTVVVTPDYLAVGSDAEYFLAPLSPAAARLIADAADGQLPTRRIVDAIHAAAPLKLEPRPIPPGPDMVTVPVFARHNDLVWEQRQAALGTYPLGTLVAGDKKDIVDTPQLAAKPGRVAIYGWHRTNGVAIQPLYLGHADSWVDYSHGLRLVHRMAKLDGVDKPLVEIMADPKWNMLVNDEGGVAGAAGARVRPTAAGITTNSWRASPVFGEQVMDFRLEPGVRVQINAAAASVLDARKVVQLVLYPLPNGNTIEQTVGKRMQPGDDWHFDIQHIGAQARWLRERETNAALVVAYFQADGQSWPAWKRQHGLTNIPEIVEQVSALFSGQDVRLTLSGHSGGGSFVFGYLDAHEHIPAHVERIAFLDSNYGYDVGKRHAEKLLEWLEAGPSHRLCVLAYHDSIALLDGKTFVSEAGGTWGRSHAMKADLAKVLSFTSSEENGLQTHTARGGQVKFFLKENPERKILHTVQVEQNGFIHSLRTGTDAEGRGYEYLGARVYEAFIQP